MALVALIGLTVFAASVFVIAQAITRLADAFRSGLSDIASAIRETGGSK